jgi:2,3-bisphosphoglycerate-independent phosphoglycerate mutase
MSGVSTGQVHTAHTTNRVPLISVNGPGTIEDLANGRLAAVAPTVLERLRKSRR